MAITVKSFCSVLLLSSVLSLTSGIPTEYNVGIGIADITGPAAEVNMMGYANPAQTSRGLHLRQFSRTFIFEDQTKNKVVFINIDACMFSQGLKLEIVRQLKAKYGDAYTERNVCITGTHTHSTPGGFHQYLLYDITSLGFVKETFDSLVEGIVKSVDKAHNNMKPANIYVNTGELLDSNINRSPSAYLKNPPEERAKYNYNVDKNMTVIKIVDAGDYPIGMISWFAVHCTSMNNTNRLISSDNKGLAALMFELDRNGKTVLPGKGEFVAAFAQSNEGDVSPNTKGPHCLDTGLPCDFNHSTCNGKNEMCVAFGPGNNMFESTEIIGRRQYIQAKKLFDTATTLLSGPVDFRHTYTDMSKQTVEGKSTCKPAMGYSFAAGTTDGPGAFDFTQGSNSSSPFWNVVSGFIKKPTPEQKQCHMPKPILLDTGEIDFPYAWEPSIVDTQILRVGQLVLIAVPAEFTTMSGRRTRDAVAKSLKDNGFQGEPIPVIAGLSNDYADYVTTFEEYQEQRYEGGSTIYGPHTLDAYINVYNNLSKAMAMGSPVALGPNPPDLISEQLSFLPPVVFDEAGFGHNFADVLLQPQKQYKAGGRVTVKFVGANPRNNRRLESTFLTVEFQEQSGANTVVYNDAHWETQFHWDTRGGLAESLVTIIWDIPADQKPGMYRITYNCDHKSILSGVSTTTGSTEWFQVTASKVKMDKLREKNILFQKKKENDVKKNGFENLFSGYISNKKKGLNIA